MSGCGVPQGCDTSSDRQSIVIVRGGPPTGGHNPYPSRCLRLTRLILAVWLIAMLLETVSGVFVVAFKKMPPGSLYHGYRRAASYWPSLSREKLVYAL